MVMRPGSIVSIAPVPTQTYVLINRRKLPETAKNGKSRCWERYIVAEGKTK